MHLHVLQPRCVLSLSRAVASYPDEAFGAGSSSEPVWLTSGFRTRHGLGGCLCLPPAPASHRLRSGLEDAKVRFR